MTDNDETLDTFTKHCSDFAFEPSVTFDRRKIFEWLSDLRRLRDLEKIMFNASHETKRRAWSSDGVCRCGGIPQTAADGTCFYCKGKVK